MAWRGSTSVQDRVVSCLPYAFPVVEAVGFGIPVMALLIGVAPAFQWLFLPLLLLAKAYGAVNSLLGGWAGFAIFFALYLLVVRNANINHFIRYNTMQALIIGIAVSLITAILQLLQISQSLGAPLPLPLVVLYSFVFLGVLAASIYSIVKVLLGQYAEIPVLSEAAYAQTRY